jgi:glycosyltransferase involved in cell wall biosynthesis
METKPIILLPARYFLPAFKAGGSVRTLKAMVENLSETQQFKVLALDRDLGEHSPFLSIQKNEWNQVGLAKVRYWAPNLTLPFRLVRTLRKTEYNILYLNSFFDPIFTLVPLLARRLRLIPDKPVVIAPRGELSPGAMAQKRLKKFVFLKIALFLGLYRNTILHASTDLEKSEIQHAMMSGNKLNIRVARDMASGGPIADYSKKVKGPGSLYAVFISRISPKKNLIAAIEMLARVNGDVSLHIYGPIDDSNYWQKCRQVIDQHRDAVRVEYKGTLAHEKVQDTLAGYDAFVFPTLGENFGHVILESLLAGCPVVTSDQTPWRNLRTKNAGWDLPIQTSEHFVEVLQALADMGEDAHRSWREGARALGMATLNDKSVLSDNQNLFANLPSCS